MLLLAITALHRRSMPLLLLLLQPLATTCPVCTYLYSARFLSYCYNVHITYLHPGIYVPFLVPCLYRVRALRMKIRLPGHTRRRRESARTVRTYIPICYLPSIYCTRLISILVATHCSCNSSFAIAAPSCIDTHIPPTCMQLQLPCVSVLFLLTYCSILRGRR